MAATLTPEHELTYVSFPLDKSKTEVTPDGDVIVYGKATDGIVDSDHQIVDPVWAAKAMKDWFNSGGNVRVQHQAQRDPAGKAIQVTSDGVGGQWLRALIVEPVAKQLVLKGVLQAFSVGIMSPNIVHDPLAHNGRINGGEMGEVSLVDRPANKGCRFELVKSAGNGGLTYVGKVSGTDEIITKALGSSVEKVGPKGYEHGWRFVGVPGGKDAEHAASSAGHDAARGGKETEHAASRAARKAPKVSHAVLADRAAKDSKSIKDLSDDDLKGVDREFAKRAKAMGKDGQVSTSHKRVKDEIARRKTKSDAKSDAKSDDEKDKKENDEQDDGGDSGGGGGGAPGLPGLPGGGGAGGGGSGGGAGSTALHNRVGGLPPGVSVIDNHVDEQYTGAVSGLSGKGVGSGVNRKKTLNSRKGTHVDTETDDTIDKGGKQCPACDRYNKKDATECAGASCDHSFKAASEDVDKAKKPASSSDDDDDDDDYDYDNGDGSDGDAGDDGADSGDDSDDDDSDDDSNDSDDANKTGVPVVKKGKMSCPKCSGMTKASSKFCPKCGASMAAPDVKKGLVMAGRTEPTPTDGVTDEHADPVPAHREPDGSAIESFEADARLPTDPDSAMKAAHRIAEASAPDDLGVLHDLLCPAFSNKALKAAYPFTELHTHLDVQDWQLKALDAAAGAPMDEAARATKRWQDVTTLASIEPELARDLHKEAHKSFQDANPGVSSFPTPSSVTPGQFKRPYLSAGHARPSFQQTGPNTADVPTSGITAAQYTRGDIVAGHAADSPNNKSASRTFYTNAQRDNAKEAMRNMHDHIAHTFPDVCPMTTNDGHGDGGSVATSGINADAVGKTAKPTKPVKSTTPSPKTPVETGAPTEVLKAALGGRAVSPDLVKSAVAEALMPLTEKLAVTEAALLKQRRTNKRLAKQIDELHDLANPAVQPYRGLAFNPPVNKGAGAGRALTPDQLAAYSQLTVQADLADTAYNSTDPRQREAALTELMRMRGITS